MSNDHNKYKELQLDTWEQTDAKILLNFQLKRLKNVDNKDIKLKVKNYL